MDLSLEEYMKVKNVAQKSNNKNQGRGSVQSRLGNKKQAGAKPNLQQYKVPAVVKTQPFDARQKLGNKPKIVDARDKLIQKTKFGDARQKIQSKQAKSGVIQLNQGKKFDARTKLKAKTQPQNNPTPAAGNALPRITVGQFGRLATTSNAPVAATQGLLLKTVNNDHDDSIEIGEDDRTYEDDDLESYQGQTGPFNATITIKNPAAIKPVQAPTEPSYKPLRGPIIQIANDRYAKSPPKPPIRPIFTQKAKPIPVIITEEQEDFMTEAFRAVPARTKTAPVRAPSPVQFQPDTLPSEDIVSPLQGFRVLITNLHPVVTQDDIIELFGSVGALKKAKLIKQGLGEVIFVHREDALSSIKKYHNRELDGVPMQVKLVNAGSPAVTTPPRAAQTIPKLRLQQSPASRLQSSPIIEQPATPQDSPSLDDDLLSTSAPIPQPLRLGSNPPKEGTASIVDIGVIHKALFKTNAEESPTRPVTFTVKI